MGLVLTILFLVFYFHLFSFDVGPCMSKLFKWNNFTPKEVFDNEVMSSVLPVQGIAGKCDWILGKRYAGKEAFGNFSKLPRSIILYPPNLKKLPLVFNCLPLNIRFVLIIAGEDQTFPRGVDTRYRKFGITMKEWHSLLNDTRIVHFFVSQLDVPPIPERVTPIPVGLSPRDSSILRTYSSLIKPINITNRKARLLFAHRVRTGEGTFYERKIVQDLCLGPWSSFCDVIEVQRQQFNPLLSEYNFLLSVHGGGIEPNPNAWTALINGAIPVMRHFPSDSIFHDLPVLWVGHTIFHENGTYIWQENMLNAERLELEKKRLERFFVVPQMREKVVKKLMLKYWWDLVEEKLKLIDLPMNS
jgi:hypothetical protein